MHIVLNDGALRNGVEREAVHLNRAKSVWAGLPIGPDQLTLDEAVEQSTDWLSKLLDPDQIVELRALKVSDGWFPFTMSGFFDCEHLSNMMREAIPLTSIAEGVYFTLNPLNRDLLARRCNRVGRSVSGDASCDANVLRRRLLLIDADPVRISGESSTDEEKAMAHDLASKVRDELRIKGWPEPVFADSGNGYHLLYRIDQPANDEGLVKRVLGALAQRFDNDKAKIDQKVFNPGRIVKLYGTLARKSVHSPERPHRWTKIVAMPERLEIVPNHLLEALAKEMVRSTPIAKKQLFPSIRPYRFGGTPVLDRARAYLDKVPPAVSGEGGDSKTFRVACILTQTFELSIEDAMPLFKEWNERCQPPWSEQKLLHKLRSAEKCNDGKEYDQTLWSGVGLEGNPEPLKADDDPHRLARLFLAHQAAKEQTLKFWRGEWWRWVKGRYQAVSETELRAELWTELEREFDRLSLQPRDDRGTLRVTSQSTRSPLAMAQKASQALVNNVLGALGGLTIVPNSSEQPSWLVPKIDGEAQDCITLQNGLLSLSKVLSDKDAPLLPHTPNWFSSVQLPYPFDPAATCPKWETVLQRNLEADVDRIALLQEWFGYCLTTDTSRQKFMVLEGEGCNGKSVICAALTALLGPDNVSHVPLEVFNQRFALTQTLRKLANIASEVGEIDRAAEGTLKAFTSGDRMMFDRKGIAPIEAMPSARLVLATNNRPRFTDRSTGLWRRMLLLPFRVEIQAAEKVYGMDKPAWWIASGELPGLFNWAIAGLRRLRQQQRFTEPAVCHEAMDQYRNECNPARMFLHERCCESTTNYVQTELLYDGYRMWCEKNGYSPLGSATFGKEIGRVYRKVVKKRAGGRLARQYIYEGLEYYTNTPWMINCRGPQDGLSSSVS